MKTFTIYLALLTMGTAAERMPWSKELWNSTEFLASFNGSYRVNAELEPNLSTAERGLLVEVQKLMQQGKRDQAVSLFKNSPYLSTSASLQYNYANVLRETGELEGAITHYEKALTLLPSFRRAHKNLGVAYMQSQELEKGQEHLMEAVNLGSQDGFVHGLLGFAFLEDGQYEAALTSYRQAIRTNPDLADWQIGLARALQGLGRNEEALSTFQAVLSSDPDNHAVRFHTALAYLQLDQTQQAIIQLEYLRRAEELEPEYEILLGSLLMGQGNAAVGSDILERTIGEPEFDQWDAALKVIRFCLQSKQLDTAKRIHLLCADAELSTKEQSFYERLKARLIFAEQPHHEEGIKVLDQLLKTNPTDIEALTLWAQQLVLKGDLPLALIKLNQALHVDDYALAPLLDRAKLYVQLKRYPEAIDDLNTYLEIQQDSAVETYLEAVLNIQKSYALQGRA